MIAGRHRVAAAIKAGIEYADVFVNEHMSDAEAVIVYATENALQDGNRASAMAGAVASATWLLVRAIMKGDVSTIVETCTRKAQEVLQGQIASSKGLGVPIVADYLKRVPGGSFPRRVVEDFFANIKSCGEYAKIVAEVRKEIDDELAEELRKAEAAQRERKRRVMPRRS